MFFLPFRNPKHRIVPAVALAGSSIPAFEDVTTTDPDFEHIQGIIDISTLFLWKLAFCN